MEFDWIADSKLIVRNGMTGATGNIYCGLHEFSDMAFVLHLLRPGDLFVDVGANIGSYTVLTSAVCGARTIAIEPDPDTMHSLRKNVIANDMEGRVTLIAAAVGAELGSVSFTIGRDTTNKVADALDGNTRVVNVRTLDDILTIDSPVLIKTDVEGYEAQVVAGSLKTLANGSLRALLIETVEAEVHSTLMDAGFIEFSYEPFDRKLIPVNGSAQTVHKTNSLFLRDAPSTLARLKDAPDRTVNGLRL